MLAGLSTTAFPATMAALVMPANGDAPPAAGAGRWVVATARGMGFFCRPDLGETTKSGRRSRI